MTLICKSPHKEQGHRPKSVEMADIFRRYQSLLGPMPPWHWKVVRDITNCRTAILGGHVSECTKCDHQTVSYNSCRSRHCPKCQFLTKAKWIEARVEEFLPVQYFHMVFTIPHEFNLLALNNKKIVYGILFKAVSETLKEAAANPKNLGAEVGFTAILHTWSQVLVQHPHLHVVIPGGGISPDGTQWINSKTGFFIPIGILRAMFKGKFLDFLKKAYRSEKLIFPGKIEFLSEPDNFDDLMKRTRKLKWIVYAKKPFSGPKAVVEYLGNYTHRIAISNYRIIKVEDNHVYFWYRKSSKENRKRKQKVMVLHVKEFMRRFLLHVLPPKFVRIRHYGFLGSRFKKDKVQLCKILHGVNVQQLTEVKSSEAWMDVLKRITGIDLSRCPKCKEGQMIELEVLEPYLGKNISIGTLSLDSS